MYNKEELKRQMAEMGLKSTDTVLIHISLKAVGETENGADGIIDAFCEYLSDGLFLVPTHTLDSVNAKNPVFDVRTSANIQFASVACVVQILLPVTIRSPFFSTRNSRTWIFPFS